MTQIPLQKPLQTPLSSQLSSRLRARPVSAFIVLIASLTLPVQAQSLLELYESARSYDAPYQSAKSQFEANLARAEQSRAGVLPSLGFSANMSRSVISVTPEPFRCRAPERRSAQRRTLHGCPTTGARRNRRAQPTQSVAACRSSTAVTTRQWGRATNASSCGSSSRLSPSP